mgnify:FL=1
MEDRLPRASDRNLDYDREYKPVMRYHFFDAVDSVACLECCTRDNGSRVYVLAGT